MGQWRTAQSLGDEVLDRFRRQPVSWHRSHPSGDLLARAGVDIEAAVSVMAPLPFASSTVLLLVVSAVWLVVTDTVLGLVAVLVIPVLVVVNLLYQRIVEPHFDEAQRHLGDLSAAVHESFEGVLVVKAFGAEQRETDRLADIALELRRARIRAVKVRTWYDALVDNLPNLANTALVVVGAVRIEQGVVSVGELASVIFLFTLLTFPLRLISYLLSELPHSLAGWRRLREILDEPVLDDPARLVGEPPAGLAVALDDVSFAYEEGRPVLDGCTLRVVEGTTLAIVGATGSGKSTLLDIVAGLQAPDSGTVAVRGRHATLVFQEAFLGTGTVRDNVALGVTATDDEIWTALDIAEASEFVRDLPRGLDTVLGERGVTLSGGQRQRLALARALVRHPSVLLLDDTTSAIDPVTEARVLGNLLRERGGLTIVLVGSRPSTIQLADRVAHLVGGRIAHVGTHAELMVGSPAYRELVEAFEREAERVA
jgi:ABC-type multidrug transport system fused ATPase/permease subunit